MQIPRVSPWLRIPVWLRLSAVMLGLGGMSVLLGVLVAKDKLLLAAGLIALVAGALAWIVVARYFLSFLLLLPVTCLAVPIEIPTGSFTKLPISLVLAVLLTVLWCASMYLRGWKLAPSPLNLPMLIFGAICVIALIWGRLWRDPGLIDWNNRFIFVQMASLIAYLISIATALMIGNFVVTERQLKWIVGVFLCFGSLIVLVQTYQIPQGFLTIKGLWSLWLIAPAYAILICQPKLKWRWRILLIVLLLMTFNQVMVRDALWLSGWVPGFAAVIIITLLRSWKAFLVLVLVSLICTPYFMGYFEQVAEDNVEEGGLERLDIWAQNLEIVRGHWLFGTGPAGYSSYYATYYRDTARSTHNNYFDILAQFGVVGMAVWLWFSAVSIKEGWRLIQRAPPGFLRTMAVMSTGGWIAALGSMMLGDWILPFAYNQTVTGFKYTVFSWIFLGTMISLRQILVRTGQPPHQPTRRYGNGMADSWHSRRGPSDALAWGGKADAGAERRLEHAVRAFRCEHFQDVMVSRCNCWPRRSPFGDLVQLPHSGRRAGQCHLHRRPDVP